MSVNFWRNFAVGAGMAYTVGGILIGHFGPVWLAAACFLCAFICFCLKEWM